MIEPGCHVAAVTPLDAKGKVDLLSVARLLAWLEAAGCQGAVLGGTNGEGPSLSPVEKRDLLHGAMPLRGKLDLMLGIATPSSDEAAWLCKQAGACGAAGVLVMPPSYFREAEERGIEAWFAELLERSPVPVVLYNFPQRTGFTLAPTMLSRLAGLPQMAGVKDSSGERANLDAYAQALPGKRLFVGNETLLLDALRAGWSGTISGAANVVPDWLSTICREFGTDPESAEVKHALLLPALEAIRRAPQPAVHKSLLHRTGVLERPDVRLPLLPPAPEQADAVAEAIRLATGHRF